MDDDDFGVELTIWMIAFTCVTLLILGLRIHAIQLTKKGVQAHDYLIFITISSCLSLTGVTAWAIVHGLGRHTTELSAEDVIVQLQLCLSIYITRIVCTSSSKLSMLALYLTLFRQGTSTIYRNIIFVLIGLVCAFTVAFIPVILTVCRPVSYLWNPVPGGECSSFLPIDISSLSVSIALDTAIAGLPIPILWNLQMPLRTKMTIVAMFSLGFSVVAVMIWRLKIIHQDQLDLSYSLARVLLPTFLEFWLSIIVVSIPTLAPLYKHYISPRLARKWPENNRMGLREAQCTIGSGPRKRRLVDTFGSTTLGSRSGSDGRGVEDGRDLGEQEDGMVMLEDVQGVAVAVAVVEEDSRTGPARGDIV
ncbi:hypothetical protein BJX99DRAFT_257680 [Aspergillus californicus]